MEEECENYEIEDDTHHDFNHLNDEHPLPSYLSPSSVRREVNSMCTLWYIPMVLHGSALTYIL